jgi:flotillin
MDFSFFFKLDWAIISSIVVLVIFAVIVYLKINLKICDPNEILIFSGKKRRLKTGEVVGYRVIRGGWGLKSPLLERVSRLSLSTISIPINISRALSNGMIPLNISAIAHVKIASIEGRGLENAVEKLLRKPETEIQDIAKSTLEGILRGILAKYTPEEANYKRMELEKELLDTAREELQILGFNLDSFKIDDIKDDQGYLEAVGRQRNAVVQRDARIKEAESGAAASIVESESKRKASDTEFKTRLAMEEYETNYRNEKARLNEKTNRLEVQASFARSIEELNQKNTYHELNKEVKLKKHHAEVVIPAEAEKTASELKAIGQASFLKEQGIAMADAVKEMKSEWGHGENKELFMLHILPNIVDNVSRVIADNLKVENLVVMGNGALPNHVGDVTSSVITFLEKINTATGLDLTKILSGSKTVPVEKELKKTI